MGTEGHFEFSKTQELKKIYFINKTIVYNFIKKKQNRVFETSVYILFFPLDYFDVCIFKIYRRKIKTGDPIRQIQKIV